MMMIIVTLSSSSASSSSEVSDESSPLGTHDDTLPEKSPGSSSGGFGAAGPPLAFSVASASFRISSKSGRSSVEIEPIFS